MLANSSVTDLYTISPINWTEIDKRVENVFKLRNIKDVVAKTIPGYPSLLESSDLWVATTLNELITQSSDVATYADNAIVDFTELKNVVDAISGNDIPVTVQNMTKEMLSDLSTSTKALASDVNVTSGQVDKFMMDNSVVDKEMSLHGDKLGIFWEPIENIITAVEYATGKITGAWRALEDDLNTVGDKEINVTMPFIMSLDIEASIVLWTEIAKDARAFPSIVQSSKNYNKV